MPVHRPGVNGVPGRDPLVARAGASGDTQGHAAAHPPAPWPRQGHGRVKSKIEGHLLPEGVHGEDATAGQRSQMARDLHGGGEEKTENEGPSG